MNWLLRNCTEIVLKKAGYNNDTFNGMAAGAISGAMGSKKGLIAGASVFGTYCGLSEYLSKHP